VIPQDWILSHDPARTNDGRFSPFGAIASLVLLHLLLMFFVYDDSLHSSVIPDHDGEPFPYGG